MWDNILAPAGCQAFWLNSNRELKGAGILSQFPQQTEIVGLCPQSSRISSTKGEHSFTGAQGDGYKHGQVSRFSSWRHKGDLWASLFPLIPHSFNKYILCNAASWMCAGADER